MAAAALGLYHTPNGISSKHSNLKKRETWNKLQMLTMMASKAGIQLTPQLLHKLAQRRKDAESRGVRMATTTSSSSSATTTTRHESSTMVQNVETRLHGEVEVDRDNSDVSCSVRHCNDNVDDTCSDSDTEVDVDDDDEQMMDIYEAEDVQEGQGKQQCSSTPLTMCPETFLYHLLLQRGYADLVPRVSPNCLKQQGQLRTAVPASSSSSSLARLQFIQPTEEQIRSYDMNMTKAVREGNVTEIRRLIADGNRTLDACNKFGESLTHLACRRGDLEVFRILMANGAKVDACDDLGRIPLHDLAWGSVINMDLFEEIVEIDPTLLLVTDFHGNTPLRFVRKELWAAMNAFVKQLADECWPDKKVLASI